MLTLCSGNIKCPIGKAIFAVNLPLNLLRATVANADAERELSITLFDTYVGQHVTDYFNQIVRSELGNIELKWSRIYLIVAI